MHEYASIMLNMIEYASTYLKKKKKQKKKKNKKKNSAQYARILNMPDALHRIGSLYKLPSSSWDRDVLRTLSNI